MTWLPTYHWHLSQMPVVLAHLRDSMVPLQAVPFDAVRVGGSKERPLPFRTGDLSEANDDKPTLMDEADALWDALVWYGSNVAQHLGPDVPSPHVLRFAWFTSAARYVIQPSHSAAHVGEQAYTVTAWLSHHADTVETLPLRDLEAGLFSDLRRLMAKYRLNPVRLRTRATPCQLCGGIAVQAEWTINHRGDTNVTNQCVSCGERYDPGQADLVGAVSCMWAPLAKGA